MNNTSHDTDALLRLADTKLVLGNVCIATVFNGRSLGDFATLLAIAGTSLGATRALYRLLETAGQEFNWLERGRSATQIASADILDAAPESWADLMATIFLTEAATAAVADQLQRSADRLLANQARMISRDSAFHMAYCLGWLKTVAEHDLDSVKSAVSKRMPLATLWIEQCAVAAKKEFLSSIEPILIFDNQHFAKENVPSEWDEKLGRTGPLPASLWEIVRFKDVELAR